MDRSRFSYGFLCIVAVFVGCRAAEHVRDPEYAEVSNSIYRSWHNPGAAEKAVATALEALEGAHAVEEYIQFALQQNPDVQASRKRMESLAYQVDVADSLEDPKLGMTFYPEEVETAAGPQEFAVTANQKIPWHGKIDTRVALAEARVTAARAELAAVELATIARVKHAYYELYFVQQSIEVTKTDQQLLNEIRDVANVRYKAGRASQQDLLRAELEISNVENELVRLKQRLVSNQARLARLLHIAPQTKVRALDEVAPQQVPMDLERLQRIAVEGRPELHAQLSALQRDRRAVDLARLDYKPDVTLGATWIDVGSSGLSPVANGQDSFLLTAGINLPIYRRRLDSSVRSAEAKAVATARTYDSMRDETLQEVVDLFSKAESQQQLLTLFREDILPKARQTLEVSSRAYNAGDVDFLQLIDNWRQLLRYEVNYRRLEASLCQTLAELEQIVGGASGLDSNVIVEHRTCNGCAPGCKYCAPKPLPFKHYDGCDCHSCAAAPYINGR